MSAGASGHSGDAAAGTISALEAKFPHIMNSIQMMWGYPELNLYFRKLTIDDRGGREGFPPEVWAEIHMLADIHKEIVG